MRSHRSSPGESHGSFKSSIRGSRNTPQVPESADRRRARQSVVDQLWEKGLTMFARKCVSPELVRIRRVDDSFVPECWEILELVSRDPYDLDFYFAADSRDRVILISDNPDAYAQFVDAAALTINSPGTAIQAVEFALVRAPELSAFRKVLRTPSDLHLDHYPAAKEETETARRHAEPMIDMPKAQRSGEDGSGYQVTLYLQQNDTVQRWNGRVAPDGAVDGELTQMIADLPVIIMAHC